MVKNRKVLLMAVFGILLVAVFLINANSGPVSYQRFHHKTQAYYANLANVCDSLFERAKNGQEEVLNGDDKVLPNIIKDLGARTVKIVPLIQGETNYGPRILIIIGVSRAGFGIEWAKSDDWNQVGLWELSTVAEGLKTVLYSTVKRLPYQ